ncbi:signalosome catalytic subunit [Aureococcus anophagefferens]|uniref:Signalosome catalytic subunit n=1 Tax=Aureococcus anophagefferens TaxID=44056 RepID=A0ABR1G1L0_AURAN
MTTMATDEKDAPKAKSSETWYSMDEAKIEEVRKAKAWMQDANYFTRVMVSPAASMKMLMHAHSGCEAGLSAGGKPLEVINYMIKLSDMVEVTRKERLMGWYHSHPFDVDEAHNHCFLSSTDLSTQLSWQNAEDPNGNPFLAIVIDPLRSFAKNSSELAAFRAYPPTASPPPNQCPDGSIVTEDAKRVEVWGSCWNRYYELKVEYFMSDQAKSIIDILNHSHLWARTLSATPALEKEHRERVGERVSAVVEKLEHAHAAHASQASRMGGGFGFPAESLGGGQSNKESSLKKASDAASGIANEGLLGQTTQLAKRHLFSSECLCNGNCAAFANIAAEYLKRKQARSCPVAP